MPVSVIGILKQNRPSVIHRMEEMRAEGESYDSIARYVTKATRVTVGRESIRAYFKSKEAEEVTVATPQAD